MRVVEVSNGLAPRLLGRYLSRLGWDVWAYEANEREPQLPAAHWAAVTSELRAGKRVVASAGELAERVARADVVVDDARAALDGVPRYHLQSLIRVRLPAYASEDAEHARFCTEEAAVMAASGVLSDMGLNRTLLGIRGSFSHLPLPSVYGSVFGLCALLGEVVQGRTASYVEVPLASALLEALVHNSIVFPVDEAYLSRRKRYLASHRLPIDEATLDTLFDPFFTLYECRDARKVYLVCPAHAKHQLNAIGTLGVRAEVLAILPVVDTYEEDGGTGIGSGHLTDDQSERVRSILKAAFAARPAAEWEELLGDAGVPAIMVRSTAEWMGHPHALASGLLADGAPCNIFWSHVLGDASAAARGAACDLTKVRVVDTTNVIAGPTISAMLARFGCEIIKVDAPRPQYAPDVTVIYGLPANIGKKSALIDVKSPNGKRVLANLLRAADVLVVNTTRGGLERMGLTYEELRALNPDLIVTRFDAWGGPLERGPLAEYLGYDDNVQAGTGVMVRYGGSHETCEEHAHVGTIDTIAGVCGAASTLHALLRRQREGLVCEARTSLAAVAQYVQFPFVVAGELPCVGGVGRRCMGMAPHHCVYEARDCHLLLTGPATPTEMGATHDEIARFVAQRTLDEVSRCLRGTRLRVTRLRTTAELRGRYLADRPSMALTATYQFVACDDHPMGRVVMVSPIAMRMPLKIGSLVAPKYGKDTLSVLNSVRMSHTYRGADSYSKGYIPRVARCDACGSKERPLTVVDCAHQLCDECIARTTRGACAVCGARSAPLEAAALRLWRDSYASWRRGGRSGSVTRSSAETGVGAGEGAGSSRALRRSASHSELHRPDPQARPLDG